MRLLHRMIASALALLSTTVGLLLISMARSRTLWLESLDGLRAHRIAALGAGAAAICLALLFVLTVLGGRRRVRYLSFRRNGDTFNISTTAITGYVTRLASEFPSIVRMTPRVKPAGKLVDILIDVRIKAGPQLHEICEVLQQRVRESMSAGLGISEIRRVSVSVTEISSEHKA